MSDQANTTVSAERVEIITNALLHLMIPGRELEFAAYQIDMALSQSGAYARRATAEVWWCEDHLHELMDHDGCKGAGVLGRDREILAVNLLRHEKQKHREFVEQFDYHTVLPSRATADVTEEVVTLRQIVSDCAKALPNGAFVSPNASLEFMAKLPGEIASVCAALKQQAPE